MRVGERALWRRRPLRPERAAAMLRGCRRRASCWTPSGRAGAATCSTVPEVAGSPRGRPAPASTRRRRRRRPAACHPHGPPPTTGAPHVRHRRPARNNETYADAFDGPLPLPPAKHIAVVACMDARLDVYGLLGLERGRGPRDPQRRRRRDRRRDPLAGDHPAPARHRGDRPDPPHRLRHAHVHRRRVPRRHPGRHRHQARRGRPSRSPTSTPTCAQSIGRIKASPFIPHTDAVRGFVFDVETGRLREVE